MNLIDMKGVDAVVKLDNGVTERVTNCNASILELDTTIYLELDKDDSVTYIDADRIVSFTLKKVSTQ